MASFPSLSNSFPDSKFGTTIFLLSVLLIAFSVDAKVWAQSTDQGESRFVSGAVVHRQITISSYSGNKSAGVGKPMSAAKQPARTPPAASTVPERTDVLSNPQSAGTRFLVAGPPTAMAAGQSQAAMDLSQVPPLQLPASREYSIERTTSSAPDLPPGNQSISSTAMLMPSGFNFPSDNVAPPNPLIGPELSAQVIGANPANSMQTDSQSATPSFGSSASPQEPGTAGTNYPPIVSGQKLRPPIVQVAGNHESQPTATYSNRTAEPNANAPRYSNRSYADPNRFLVQMPKLQDPSKYLVQPDANSGVAEPDTTVPIVSQPDQQRPFQEQGRPLARPLTAQQTEIAAVNAPISDLPFAGIYQDDPSKLLKADPFSPSGPTYYGEQINYAQLTETFPVASQKGWVAPNFYSNPLYFEEPQLERYGNELPFQNVRSGIHFFGTIPFLPYKMGDQTPFECVYTYGADRPGNCVPFSRTHRPLSLRGVLNQAFWTTAIVVP